jgi:hypothetical protein
MYFSGIYIGSLKWQDFSEDYRWNNPDVFVNIRFDGQEDMRFSWTEDDGPCLARAIYN